MSCRQDRSQAAAATRSPLHYNPLVFLSLVALCALLSLAIYKLNAAQFATLHYCSDVGLEGDILSALRTSFVPPQEELTARRGFRAKRNAKEEDGDGLAYGDGEILMLRAKRSFALDSDDRVPTITNDKTKSASRTTTVGAEDAYEDTSADSNDGDEDHYYDAVKNVNDEWGVEGTAPGERGPLPSADDVVDEMRAQPELEDGEAAQGTAFRFQDPQRERPGGIPAIWKGAEDAESIRAAQAELMSQYIDASVDPCVDFYQYACGNWAAHNPIPADKAGYDTFEILRENLDAVLGDLLTLKDDEQLASVYPGPKLELDHNALVDTVTAVPNVTAGGEIRKQTDSYLEEPGDYTIQFDTVDERKKRGIQSDNVVMILGGNKQEQISTDNIGDPAKGDATLKAKYLYKSCMNHAILAKRGSQPLLDLLKMLGGWPILQPDWNASNFDWLELIATLRLYNNDILISEWVGPDIKNSDEFVIQFDQTSLGLPTRDYFLSPVNRVYLEAYRLYLVKTACLLGARRTVADRAADHLVAFETKLAAITSAPEDRRNVSELYRRLSVEELAALVPAVNWRRYLHIVLARTPDPQQSVVMFALEYVQQLVALLNETDPRTVSNYLLWRFVRHRINNLDDRFQRVKQQFYFTLFGREQAPPRWKACVGQVNSNMGMALGAMFVRARFDGRSKKDTTAMTRDIQRTFRGGLHSTAWIDDETRRLAVEKLDAITLRIGYPDYILDTEELNRRYHEVHIHPDKYFENTLNILQHLTKVEQARLGQPVNKTVWNTAPAVVNAYYSRNKNQITFPAGILQPPFYHRAFPRSLNYGGIGVVIGHEMTHGFDDKGRLFDKHGNLRRWWGERAVDAFHRRAQCLVDQYSHFVVKEVGMNVDGVSTQGENIADNGGIKQAFRSYWQWVERHGARHETLPGLNATHFQLFFLNFAQVWCGSMRPEATRNKLKTAVHSPGRFRVLGTLCNSAEFAREFSCPPGSPMNPLRKCSVW